MGLDPEKEEPVNFDIANPDFLEAYLEKTFIRWKRKAWISGGLTGNKESIQACLGLTHCGF